MHEETIEPNQI